jgi:hypothetical protein
VACTLVFAARGPADAGQLLRCPDISDKLLIYSDSLVLLDQLLQLKHRHVPRHTLYLELLILELRSVEGI